MPHIRVRMMGFLNFRIYDPFVLTAGGWPESNHGLKGMIRTLARQQASVRLVPSMETKNDVRESILE